MERERIIEMHINSYLDRIETENSSTSKQFTVSLQNRNKQIELLPNERELLVKCFKLQIPNVLYNFELKESRLWFTYTKNGDEKISSVQIETDRVYASPSNLMDEINGLFPSGAIDSDTGNTTDDLSGMEIAYDNDTKKCTLTNNTARDVRLISSFRYANVESILTFNDMNDRLGFADDYTTSGTMSASGGTLVSNGTIRMNRTNCYNLVLEEQSGFYTQSITPLDTKNHRIIASVEVGPYGTLSTFSYVSSFGFHLPIGQPVNKLTFSLRDSEMQPVDFVNHPITMSLQFIIK